MIEPSVLDCQTVMVIEIIPDKDSNTLTLIETGIGMSKAELINSLGTIARMNSRWRPKMDAPTYDYHNERLPDLELKRIPKSVYGPQIGDEIQLGNSILSGGIG